MTRARVIVEPHEVLPCRDQRDLVPKSASRPKLLGQDAGKPFLRAVGQTDAPASARQRQRSHETVAATVLEATLNPCILVGDAISGIGQDFDVTEWCLVWIVKGHVSPPTIT